MNVKQTRFTRAALTALCLTILIAGCANDDQPPQYVIVTSTPDFTAAPPPSQTLPPTITLPPTPTIPPDTILRAADRQLLNGRYEDAAATYNVLLAQAGVPDAMRADAALKLGQAAVREGLFDAAVTALTGLIDSYPNDPKAALARFLRGDAYLGLSQWANAIADFEAYLVARPGLIDSYAHERIGDAQLALGQTAAALTRYQQAADASRSTVLLVALRERLAQVLSSSGRTLEAVAQYDKILEVAQNAAYRATIEMAAARVLLASPLDADKSAGVTRAARVFTDYADTPTAYEALGVLTDNGSELNQYAVGRVMFAYGDYPGAVEAFNTYTAQTASSEIPAELYLMLGRAYREIGNTEAAVTAFQTIVERYPTDPLFGDALLEQGRSRFLADDVPGAIQAYLQMAQSYDYLPQAAEALWRAGYLYSVDDQREQARPIFEQLADRYPATSQARSGLALAASAAFNAGEDQIAERFYAELAVKATGEEQASAYLIVARLALKRGDQNAATQALAGAVTAAPDSYTSQRAADIAAGRPPFQRPAEYRFAVDEAAALGEAETWLRAQFGITQEGALWQLSPALAADPRLIRGSELWGAAAVTEAKIEFSDLIDAYEADPLASYQIAVHLRGIAAYQSSIFAAANVIIATGVGTLEAPSFIARMRYPAYYLDVVQEVAARRNFDPLLLFSLIRHESLFDTYATAGAGEKGLTQVIPSTADYIASQIGFPDYQHADLFRPYAGIEFGGFYLAEQLNLFDGTVTAALGAYNAGPGRAQSWLAIAGTDHDSFMSAITIDSTRTYIQRIYGFYNIYRALYGA
ncbi:MAG: tetratricopeptide repeat protein [Chloroflexota bacterium]|nr:tetratricopeptide repeat protein [Chloroflexota bacterium]